MSQIIAARFETFDQAAVAAGQLFERGFAEADMHTFYVNTAGRHASYPVGGDRRADPDARGAALGAFAGAAFASLVLAGTAGFLVARLTGSMLAVIAAAGVGAYIGALAGALWINGRRKRMGRDEAGAADGHPAIRHEGVMLALRVDPARQAEAAAVLRAAGGVDVERANGRWVQGRWEDFDPLTPPQRDSAVAGRAGDGQDNARDVA
ncbi:hypothetical protein [Bordetella hinzii]|uniref:hypothetical protein n=1 Tax=Bordetella hinzii TaxID=103855 RepID=UPI0006909ECE|nr:hypothetical protein [Bordetella hinzii]KXA71111.1 hypothetical protein AXA74_20195 [Bordetella hinzii LMG 13501]QDJ38798.1 hypothetical protein CBR67_20115 [Bordetella hinzii]QDJ47885.1 hypothetical protein CBR71_19755 [Bordetella hinzii]QDJ56772.1 hypothetical protein CBR72_19050 [Bordetella hinzii]VEH24112.1 Uncharacterised protein [Bordetella hinzii]